MELSQGKKPEGKRHRWPLAVAAGTLVVAAACSGGGKHNTADQQTASNTNSFNGSIGVNNGPAPTKPPSDFAWGPRVSLALQTYGIWNPNNPEPVKQAHLSGKDKYLLVVDDGRYNFPKDPNPDTDQPTGIYPAPTQTSEKWTAVQDGTVLKVIAWTNNGQLVSDAHGGQGYPTWEEVVSHDGTEAWVPWVNVGYTALSQLHQLPEAKTGS